MSMCISIMDSSTLSVGSRIWGLVLCLWVLVSVVWYHVHGYLYIDSGIMSRGSSICSLVPCLWVVVYGVWCHVYG